MVLLKSSVLVLGATSITLCYLMITEFNPFIRRCNPGVCHDYALSKFKVHSVQQTGAGNCEYGLLPGFLSLNVMKPAGARFQTASSQCALTNLMAPDAPTGRVKVMLFGDSVDAHLAYEWCSLLQQPLKLTPTGLRGSVAALAAAVSSKANAAAAGLTSGGGNTSSSSSSSSGRDGGSSAAAPQATPTDAHSCCKNRDRFYHCAPGKPDAANSVSIAMYHLLGVHLNGPYHTGATGNFLTRIPAALKTFNATFGAPPDVVLLHSNFWDQSRMWEQHEPGFGQLTKLLPDTVFSFSSNFSLLLSTTRELLPESTLLATRTAAFPAFTANWLGRWSYIYQLNMAAVEVTRLHGLPPIDVGSWVFGLPPQTYLDDQHHPSKVVLLEVANVALNLLAQQRKRQAAERAHAASQDTRDAGDAKTAVAAARAAVAAGVAAGAKQPGSQQQQQQPTTAAG